MTTRPPSRLPSAFIRVSRCPVCRYSLKDLAQDAPCPECGAIIDRDLITSPEMQDAVVATKAWCTFGIIGWALTGVTFWFAQMIPLALRSAYGGVPPTDYERIGAWLRSAIIIAPLALLFSWARHTRKKIYTRALRSNNKPRTPMRVILIAPPGVLGGLGFCLLFTCLLGQ